ncbi:kinase/pyrophosphorylase [Ectothiorhodospiraceae bacterium WFHF3C12]|nr:kinase/pyrophosphorylase [Ectothiorhodospiraceae bacterium WFHF3C12]
MNGKRTVFFVSDRTGITAETLGHSLLTQFDAEFEQVTLPFTDNPDRARAVLQQIQGANEANGSRSIVFSTIIDDEVREIIRGADAVVFDFFDTFIAPLERELDVRSSHTIGRSHGLVDNTMYDVRIDAMNYALNHDDGATTRHYHQADIIMVGVSRCGKTPTCIYLALQYGIYAANYPLTDEDLSMGALPKDLEPHANKLYGLTILPERLEKIRAERRPNSRYASLRQCQYEVARAEAIFRRERIPFVNTTTRSIEEIATTILHETRLKRRLY